MTNRIKQELKPAFTFEDLNYLELRPTLSVGVRISKYFMRNGKIIGVDYEEILFLLGLKDTEISENLLELLQKYQVASPDERIILEQENTEAIEIIKDVVRQHSEREVNFESLQFKLIDFWVNKCHDEEFKPNKEFLEIYNILELCLGDKIQISGKSYRTIEVLKATHILIIRDLFLMVFRIPDEAKKDAFFLNLLGRMCRSFIRLLSTI